MVSWQDRFRAGGTNARLGRRFDESGRFLPEHGNTVLARVSPGSPTQAALIALRDGLMRLPFADHFAFTDVPSYHMTVFEGVIETRRAPDFWPADLPLDTGIDAMTEAMASKLERFAAPPRFRMRVMEVTPTGLRLTGATAEDEANARAWRDALAAALGYRTPGHDAYRFHTTLAYEKRWPPAGALPAYIEALAAFTAEVIARVPVMDFDPPAFCRFADMNAFPAVRAL